MEKVLIVGVGDLGSHLLEFIARDDNNLEWIIGDLDINKVKLLCNNATMKQCKYATMQLFNMATMKLYIHIQSNLNI